MPYTTKEPPEWMKNLPSGAVKIGVEVFNRVFAESKDEDKARKACWAAIKARYEKGADGKWTARNMADSGTERQKTLRFRAAQQMDETGLVWEAVLIEPGLSLSYPRFFWTDEVLEASAGLFQGVDINAYELTADFFSHLPIPDVALLEDVKRYLTARKVGWTEKAWWEPGVGVKAEIQFLAKQDWVPKALAQASGQDPFGLSIDSRVKGFEVMVDDFSVVWVTQITGVSSVDVVTRPAAGGKFLRAIAGLQQQPSGGQRMDREKLLALISELKPKLLEGKDRAALSEDEILSLARQAMTEKQEGTRSKGQGEDEDGHRAAQGLTPEQIQAEIGKAVKEVETRAACGRMLDRAIVGIGLPHAAKERIRETFEGRIFEQAELDAAVKKEKDYLASMAVPGLDLGDQGRVTGGIRQRDKIEMALDMLFGIGQEDVAALQKLTRLDHKPLFEGMRAAQDYAGIPRLTGLREFYTLVTGDPEVTGQFHRENLAGDLRAAQDITSTTFTYLLTNTMNRRLVSDYRMTDFKEDLLISIRKPVKDFRTQEAVNVGYFGDVSTVDPETADYVEIAGVTDEESSYAIIQKGNLLTFTRKTIINDDVSVVQRLVSRLGRALRRTHAKYVWAFFTGNATCSDGTAWFTGGHGNLGAAALTHATAQIAYLAIAAFTEKDSGEAIGLLDDPSVKPVLVYPIALAPTGEQVWKEDHYYATNDLTDKTPNFLYGKIRGEMVSLLSDVTDWGLLLPPGVVDMIEMGYLNGRQEPEFFLADAPTSEQVFVADKIRHKFRHEYAGAAIDFRSGYKAVVAG